MACMEEVSMEAKAKSVLKPFTAAKSADAVAGVDGPVVRFPTKRKVVAGPCYEEGLDFEGSDTASFDPAVIGAMVHEGKLPAAAPGRKHRLSKAEIRTILALKPGTGPLRTTDYLGELADISPNWIEDTFSTDWLKERKLQLEAVKEVYKEMAEESEVFREQVIKSVLEKGYFEVDEEFFINRKKANQQALADWAEMDFSGISFATEEEEAEMEAEWYPHYVPDDEDAAILSLLPDDEEIEAQVGDEAHVHKVAAIEAN